MKVSLAASCLSLFAVLLPAVALAADPEFNLAASNPGDAAAEVPISASLHLRFSDAVDPATLDALTVHQLSDDTDTNVTLQRATDLTNASITLAPKDFLTPRTAYEIRGTNAVRSADGKKLTPFRLRFTTGEAAFDSDRRLHFTHEVFDQTRSMTTVLFGPDRRLYAASAFGELVCWDIDANTGTPVNRSTIVQDPTSGRQYIDLEWDPQASADNLVLWVSYAERLTPKVDPRHFFSGEIARLKIVGERIVERTVLVTGLPHGREQQGGFDTLPHQPNGLCFHEGNLYQSVGSTSSSGGPANWGVPEQALSAAILEIDYRNIHEPFDVAPESDFDPSAENSAVKIFATGVRNALEIVAHSNGRLYTAVNINDRDKASDGVPDHPGIPGDQNQLIKKITPDHESLYLLERGRHYGFPNPAREQFVLGGGNPTADADPFEIDDYPVGTSPDPGFAPELMFPIWRWGGTSPDGMIEYAPDLPHPLAGTLMCCFYSAGDIAVMTLGSDGLPTAVDKLRGPKGKLPLTGPLDITQDPATGILYIAAFGTQNKFGSDGSMLVLRPVGVAPDSR